jgi:hypothetical protein
MRARSSDQLGGFNLEETVPLVAALLGLPIPDRYPPLLISPEQQRRRLITTLVDWVFAAARQQPQVVVVEDLHWPTRLRWRYWPNMPTAVSQRLCSTCAPRGQASRLRGHCKRITSTSGCTASPRRGGHDGRAPVRKPGERGRHHVGSGGQICQRSCGPPQRAASWLRLGSSRRLSLAPSA